MKPSSSHNPSKTPLAITVCEQGRVVYADPLSRALLGVGTHPTPAAAAAAPLFGEEAKEPFPVRCDFSLRGRQYTAYATLPQSGEDPIDEAVLSRATEEALGALRARVSLFLRTLSEQGPSAFSLSSYFRSLMAEVAASLYTPLRFEIDQALSEAVVHLHRTGLSRAIGVALAALLAEGQSRLAAILTQQGDFIVLSLDGDRAVSSPFLRALLDELADRSGFLVRHTERGLSFWMHLTSIPAVPLRDENAEDALHLIEGYTFLL